MLRSSKPAVCLTRATKSYPRAPTTKPISFFRNSCSRILSGVITAMVRTMPHKNETFLLKISKSYLLMSEETMTLTSVYSCWLLCFERGRGGKANSFMACASLQRDGDCRRFIAFDYSCLERVQVDRQSQGCV